ncbi:hypothetical protein [Bacillus mojavensis]
MWYVRKECMRRVANSSGFDNCLKTIKKLVEEGNAFPAPATSGKTNTALQYHIRAVNEGYEFVYFDIG